MPMVKIGARNIARYSALVVYQSELTNGLKYLKESFYWLTTLLKKSVEAY